MRKLFKLNTEIFIKRSMETHGGIYGYDKAVYTGTKNKILIYCPIHKYFSQEAESHMRGRRCPKCSGFYKNNMKEKIKYFVKKAEKLHGKLYDYSKLVSVNYKDKLIITCKKHGDFNTNITTHLKGIGCPYCNGSLRNTSTFIEDAINKHDGTYTYENCKYVNAYTKVSITCKKHGDFKQTPSSHLSGTGCPKCRSSKGERLIRNYLKSKNVSYIEQFNFNKHNDLKGKGKNWLRFDFYLPGINTCIEFDGIQHFKPLEIFGGEKAFKINVFNDARKTIFCRRNNIKLIRIPYHLINQINKILDDVV